MKVCQTFEVAFLVEFFANLRPLDQWTPDVFFFCFSMISMSRIYLSNEKIPGCLGYIGDYTTPL